MPKLRLPDSPTFRYRSPECPDLASNPRNNADCLMLGAVADRALDPEAVWGKFARDSPLEGDGFEPSVPRQRISVYRVIRSVACEG